MITSRYDPTNPVDVSSVPEVADGGERCLSSPSFGDTVWFRASWRSWLKFHISFPLLGPSHEVLKFRTVIESPARDVSVCLVCGDDWIEEPEGTSFPPRKLKLSTTTRTTARDWSFDVAPQTFAVTTIRIWFVTNGNLAQRLPFFR